MSGSNLFISIVGVIIAGYLMKRYIKYTYEEGIKAGFKMHHGVSAGKTIDEMQSKYDRYKRGA